MDFDAEEVVEGLILLTELLYLKLIRFQSETNSRSSILSLTNNRAHIIRRSRSLSTVKYHVSLSHFRLNIIW